MNLAFALEGYGMMLCTIENYRQIISESENFTCIDGINAFVHLADGAISVHHEPMTSEKKVFLISA